MQKINSIFKVQPKEVITISWEGKIFNCTECLDDLWKSVCVFENSHKNLSLGTHNVCAFCRQVYGSCGYLWSNTPLFWERHHIGLAKGDYKVSWLLNSLANLDSKIDLKVLKVLD